MSDLDEKIDFQSVLFVKSITQNMLSFRIEGLTYSSNLFDFCMKLLLKVTVEVPYFIALEGFTAPHRPPILELVCWQALEVRPAFKKSVHSTSGPLRLAVNAIS